MNICEQCVTYGATYVDLCDNCGLYVHIRSVVLVCPNMCFHYLCKCYVFAFVGLSISYLLSIVC